MKTYKFKSNIQCNGCLSKVSPILEKETHISKWDVDLLSDDRILSVECEGLSNEEIKQIVGKIGFMLIDLE